MESDGSSQQQKSQLTKKMTATCLELARQAIQAAGEQLSTVGTSGKHKGITPGIRLRKKMDTDKDSARMKVEDVVGQQGVRAIEREVLNAYNKLKGRNTMEVINASRGSVCYTTLYFKRDPSDPSEEPQEIIDLSEPRSKFPTVGFYWRKVFHSLPLFTLYLEEVVYKGVALALPDQPLNCLRSNYLTSYVGQKRKDHNNGSHHVDFNAARQHLWDEKGHPATNILCIKGETNLNFSSVSRAMYGDDKRKLKKGTTLKLTPGDSVWFGWRQYHATHVPEDVDYIGSNIRLQCMLAPSLDDLANEEVTVHSNAANKTLYDQSTFQIESGKRKSSKS